MFVSKQNKAQPVGPLKPTPQDNQAVRQGSNATPDHKELSQAGTEINLNSIRIRPSPQNLLITTPNSNAMSFDQLSSLESQPTTMRRQDDPHFSDDPEFQRLSQELMDKLFTLSGNISRLSNEVALLGTKRDTERVRERVHELLEESRDGFKEVGEGVKTIQSWEDVNVSYVPGNSLQ